MTRNRRPPVLALIALAGVLVSWPTHAAAQSNAPLSTIQQHPKGGDCSVTVTVGSGLPAGTEIDLGLNGLWVARQGVGSRPQMVLSLIAPLQPLDRLQVEIGSLSAIRLGARINRVPTESAIEYESEHDLTWADGRHKIVTS